MSEALLIIYSKLMNDARRSLLSFQRYYNSLVVKSPGIDSYLCSLPSQVESPRSESESSPSPHVSSPSPSPDVKDSSPSPSPARSGLESDSSQSPRTRVPISRWPSGIGSHLGRKGLRVRLLAVSDIYPVFIERLLGSLRSSLGTHDLTQTLC